MAVKIQMRRGTAAEWTSANPVLAAGEAGLETDTGNVRYGDGVTAWDGLSAHVPLDVIEPSITALQTDKADVETVTALTPGPGEVIVGGADGPVAVAVAASVTFASQAPELALGDVNTYRSTDTRTACTWVTPDGSGVVVHPSVRYFPAGFAGHQWWAAATPYTNTDNQVENPCVFVSTNGTEWAPPAGVTNPLVAPPGGGGYNSDTHLLLAPDGRLLLYFRQLAGTAEMIKLMTSTDGVSWSTPVTVLQTALSVSRLASPAVWYDVPSQQWVMLGVEILSDPREIWRYTADAPEGPWEFDAVVPVTPAWGTGRSAWHLDAQPIGANVLAVIHDAITDGAPGRVYLASSSDSGQTFSRATAPILIKNGYRSCALPIYTDSGVALHLWLGGGVAPTWGVSRAIARATAPDTYTQQLTNGLAQAPIHPYVFGDGFDRPDATGLGAAPSGQTWTASAGTMEISGGVAKGTAVGNQRSVVNIGVSDYIAEITIASAVNATGKSAFLVFRFVDADNYLRFGFGSGTVKFDRVTAGAVTELDAVALAEMGTHVFGVRCEASVITLSVDGSVWTQFTIAQGATATTIGLQTSNSDMTFDNLTVRRL